MDIKAYLGRYKTASLAIDAHTEAFKQLAGKIEYYNKLRSFKPLVQRLTDNLKQLSDKILADIVAMDDIRTEIKALLDKLPDEKGRLILYYRFCQGKTETETAKIIGCSRSIITKSVPQLLEELEQISRRKANE